MRLRVAPVARISDMKNLKNFLCGNLLQTYHLRDWQWNGTTILRQILEKHCEAGKWLELTQNMPNGSLNMLAVLKLSVLSPELGSLLFVPACG
jgi:hypothetical protein